MNNREDLLQKINKVIENNNMELVELNIKSKDPALVEVIIYKKEGITLDDCSLISRAIDNEINFDDYFIGNFNLEVASPGLDRKLKTIDDFRRNKGNMVEVRLYSKVNNQKDFIGILSDYTEDKVFINSNSEIFELDHSNIALMRQYIDFGR